MADRSCRPHRCPRRTPPPVVRKIVHLRWKQRLGPVQIAAAGRPGRLHRPCRVLVRCRISRLGIVDRATGQPIRRYEHAHPGELVHVDIKKLGNIPAGGGRPALGRARRQDATARPTGPPASAARHRTPADRATGSSTPPSTTTPGWPTARSTTTRPPDRGRVPGPRPGLVRHPRDHLQRVLTDNGSCYRSHAWRDALPALDDQTPRTRPDRPQTNGKVERFNRTLLEEWAYQRLYTSEQARRAAFEPGCTGTTTTGPTPHSAAFHPSPAAPTSPSLTPR